MSDFLNNRRKRQRGRGAEIPALRRGTLGDGDAADGLDVHRPEIRKWAGPDGLPGEILQQLSWPLFERGYAGAGSGKRIDK